MQLRNPNLPERSDDDAFAMADANQNELSNRWEKLRKIRA